MLWRRRAGLNQVQAAAALEVSVEHYRDWEAGLRTPPKKELGEIAPHELCVILRRRKGMLQRTLADAIGCTRLWVIQMENGDAPADLLRAYWKV